MTMQLDKKKALLAAIIILVTLLPVIFVSALYIRITAAVLLTTAAVAVHWLVKKRSIPSINKRQVMFVLAVIAAVYLMLLYILGTHFGFYRSSWQFSLKNLLMIIIPSAVIIIATEIIRTVLLSQNNAIISVLSYFVCLIADICLGAGIARISSTYTLMDVVASTLFSAITANLLYHYISKRYGPVSVPYRLILTLYLYLIPFVPAVPDAIKVLSNILLPLAVYIFIKALYERQQKFATKKKSKWRYIGTGSILVVMISVVMLITCQFRFGLLVIGSQSMTGAINKGDLILIEQYDGQIIREGDVIVFTKDGSDRIVHRVVSIQNINGQNRYQTKGDANKDWDEGYITDSNIVAVVHLKLSYIGYPSVFLRELFD